MADHYNHYPLKHFAATVADCMGLSLPDPYAPPIRRASRILKERLGGMGITFESVSAAIKTVWNALCEFLAPVFEGAFQVISTVLGTVLDVLLGLFDVFSNIFQGNWSGAWGAVKGIFSSIWEGIKSIFSTVLETLKGVG